jgi:benzoate-CoA ligase
MPKQPYNAALDLLTRGLLRGGAAKTAFVDSNQALTYGELAHRAWRAAAGLRALGVQPEQRVLLVMLDTVDFPVAFLGAMLAGAVPVPVNTLMTTADYAYFLEDSRAAAAVVSEALLGKVMPAVEGRALRALVIAGMDEGGDALGQGLCSFEQLLELSSGSGSGTGSGTGTESGSGSGSGADAVLALLDDARAASGLPPPLTCADDVAFWLYSSGSTGQPKGAMHLHASLAATADTYADQVLGLVSDDTVFSAAKLFFAYGLGNSLTFPMSVGATAVLLAERPTPAAVIRTLRRYHPTVFCGVPTLYAALLAEETHRPDGASPALRRCVSAGEALPKHIGEHWQLRTGVDILDGIGSTEMLHIFLSNRPGQVRYGTTGWPVPGYEVELRGERGERLAADAGDEGALWVRGPSAAMAYWNQRERSLATFHGPWTSTGDRYRCDEEGAYVYCGRNDDMLKVGGVWVAPFEVESALASHPLVLEAAVVGAADGDGLIKPKAFVVLQEASAASVARSADAVEATAELIAELQAFIKDRLAPYKYPRWVEFVVELPKTATGKIQRFLLR